MKYRVIQGFMLSPMGKPYRVGDIIEPQPNVAQTFVDRGYVELVIDEPEVETAAMASEPTREVTRKRAKKRSVVA